MPSKPQVKSEFSKKVDRFLAGLFLTPEGRPKSAKLLYSFCLSLVFMAVYGLCYWFLVTPLEQAFSASSPAVRNLFEAVVPGLAGSALCCSLYFVFKDKSYLPCTYTWLTLFAIAAVAALIALTEREARSAALYFSALLIPTGLVSGSAFSWRMYLRWRRVQDLQKQKAVANNANR
jgi:CDP-diglyceride synthetase